MEVPLFKMISSYANKYRSASQLENHPTWAIEVDKIFKACKVRKELDVESVINDMVNLGADEIALLEEKHFAATVGTNEERTLTQKLKDVLMGKEDKPKRAKKATNAVADTEAVAAPKKKRTAKKVSVDDDIIGGLNNLNITTNKTSKKTINNNIDYGDGEDGEEDVEDVEEEEPIPQPPVVPKRAVKKAVNKSGISSQNGGSKKPSAHSSMLNAPLDELENF